MKISQKTFATLALLAVSLAAPITILAATTSKTIAPTPTEAPVPTVEPTIAPVEATPVPQSTTQWIMTHKKISLGVLLVVVAAGYGVSVFGKKNAGSPPEEQSKPEEPIKEEEPKEEEQKPPEDAV